MMIHFSRTSLLSKCHIDHPSTVTEEDRCPLTDSAPLHPVLPPLACLHWNQTIMDDDPSRVSEEGDERTSRSSMKVHDAYVQPIEP